MTKKMRRAGTLTIQAIMFIPLYILIFLTMMFSVTTFVKKNTATSAGTPIARSAVVCESFYDAFDVLLGYAKESETEGYSVRLANLDESSDKDIGYYTENPQAAIYLTGTLTTGKPVATCVISDSASSTDISAMNEYWDIGNILVLRFVYTGDAVSASDIKTYFTVSFYSDKVVAVDPNPKVYIRMTIEND